MAEELTRSLTMLAERGTRRGAEEVLMAAERKAAAPPPTSRPTWPIGLVVATATAAAVLLVVATLILMMGPSGPDVAPADIPSTTIPRLAEPPADVFLLEPVGDAEPFVIETAIGRLEISELERDGSAWPELITATNHGFVAVVHGLDDLGNFEDQLYWTTDGSEWRRAESADLLPVRGLAADDDDLIAYGRSGAVRYRWHDGAWRDPQQLDIKARDIASMAFGDHGAVALVETTLRVSPEGVATGPQLIMWSSDDGTHFEPSTTTPMGLATPARDLADADPAWPFTGNCMDMTSMGGTPQPIATDDGFVLILPTHARDISISPICEPVVWHSDDGDTWTQVPGDAGFGPRAFVHSIAARHGRYLAVGGVTVENEPPISALWQSDDAVNWTRMTTDRSFGSPPNLVSPEVAVSSQGWFLADATGSLWVSSDGTAWDGPHQGPDHWRWWSALELAISNDLMLVDGNALSLGVLHPAGGP